MSLLPSSWCPISKQKYHGFQCPFCPEKVEHSEPGFPFFGDVVAMTSIQGMVMSFHRAMEVPVLPFPKVPDELRVRLRMSLIAEEFFECMEAVYPRIHDSSAWGYLKKFVNGIIQTSTVKVDLPKLADGLCDLDYVVEGTRLECGIDGPAILAEVHSANMRKVGGPVRADGKRLKPPGWKPPDIAKVLRQLGWKE